jgi:preprotein translocase subunit SecF
MVRLSLPFDSREKGMKKTVLIFGLISGAVSSIMMIATVPFADKFGYDKGAYVVGYTAIVLSFLLVYFGIRSYRDNAGNGHITFAKAFAVGILITLISCIFYVVTWEVIYFNFMHDFMDKYGTHTIEKLKASGVSAATVQAQVEHLKKFKELYENPFFNAAMTFIEPFPVGLAISLISAAVLRKKPRSQPAQSPLQASS